MTAAKPSPGASPKPSMTAPRVLATIQGPAKDLADGKHHIVRCTRTGRGITIQVDGLTPRTKTYSGGVGSVSNTALALGAKAESTAPTGFDWFEGLIYDAWVR
jgi:Laminin G domain